MNNIIKRKWNQNSMVIIEDLQGMAFQAESGGHTFQISGIDGEGNTVALSGTPAGVMLRSDGQDVTLTCSVSGGVVYATLPANAYVVPGRFGLTIFLTSDGQKTAIYAAVGTVGKTSSGTVAPPAGSDVVDLMNAIAAAVATIPASYTDLMASVAPTYSSSGLYAVGSYAWYNGKLYRCTTAITSGETWTSGHWTLANLGSDLVDLKSALTLVEEGTGIHNKSIEDNKVNIFDYGNNLLDVSKVVNGFIDNHGNIGSGNFKTTDYIPVEAGDVVRVGYESSGTKYQGQYIFTWCVFDNSYNVISAFTSTNVTSVTVAENGKYIRLSLNQNFFSANVMVYKNTETMPDYESFAIKFKEKYQSVTREEVNTIENDIKNIENGSNLKYYSVDDVKLSILETGSNLLDVSKITTGFISQYGVIDTTGTQKTTDYIPVAEGDVIRCGYQFSNGTKAQDQAIFTWCTFDENYNLKSAWSTTNNTSVTIPSGAKYVRLSLNGNYFSANVIVYKNTTTMPDYEAYNLKLKDKYLKPISIKNLLIVNPNDTSAYSTILSAINAASTGDVIVVFPGTYNEVISVAKDFTLIGTDREKCILQNTSGAYANTPLYVSGNVNISNLTVRIASETGTERNGYAVHIDKSGAGVIRFTNCTFYNNVGAALGAGGQENQYTYFDNCKFICDEPETNGTPDTGFDSYGAVFFHAPTSSNIGGCGAEFKDCIFTSTLSRVLTFSSIQDASEMYLTFINCLAYSKYNKRSNVVQWNAQTYLKISDMSYGNSTSELNPQ